MFFYVCLEILQIPTFTLNDYLLRLGLQFEFTFANSSYMDGLDLNDLFWF